jgi:uncharacterized protein (TIGR02147 family)
VKAQLRVFAFEDPVDYLNYELKERQKLDSRFSIREWARRIGYANPSYLSEVLRRERKLTVDLATKLALNLGLEGKAYRYFELTVLLQGSISDREKRFYTQLLNGMRPADLQQINQVSLDAFSLISDWYHWAIVEMTALKDFVSDEKYIQRRLVDNLDGKTIRGAIDRLLKTGLLAKDESGELKRANDLPNLLDPKMARMAAREYQRQMADRARASLEDQASEEIDFQGSTISFSRAKMEQARAIMRQAHKALLELGDTQDSEEVYQFNTQFFRLTKEISNKRGRKKAKAK